MEPPGPPNPKALPLLHPADIAEAPEKGVPRREGAALVDGRDIDEGGRSGSLALFVEDCRVARPSGWYSSSSSEAASVMRDEITLGAEAWMEVEGGMEKEALVGES